MAVDQDRYYQVRWNCDECTSSWTSPMTPTGTDVTAPNGWLSISNPFEFDPREYKQFCSNSCAVAWFSSRLGAATSAKPSNPLAGLNP